MGNEIKSVVREETLFAGIRKPIESREELVPTRFSKAINSAPGITI